MQSPTYNNIISIIWNIYRKKFSTDKISLLVWLIFITAIFYQFFKSICAVILLYFLSTLLVLDSLILQGNCATYIYIKILSHFFSVILKFVLFYRVRSIKSRDREKSNSRLTDGGMYISTYTYEEEKGGIIKDFYVVRIMQSPYVSALPIMEVRRRGRDNASRESWRDLNSREITRGIFLLPEPDSADWYPRRRRPWRYDNGSPLEAARRDKSKNLSSIRDWSHAAWFSRKLILSLPSHSSPSLGGRCMYTYTLCIYMRSISFRSFFSFAHNIAYLRMYVRRND